MNRRKWIKGYIGVLLLLFSLLCGGCALSGTSSVPEANSDTSDFRSLTREGQEIYNYSPVCPQAWIDETGAVRFSETIKGMNAEARSLDGQPGAVSVVSDEETECYILWSDGSLTALYSETERLSEEWKEIQKQQKSFYESLQVKAVWYNAYRGCYVLTAEGEYYEKDIKLAENVAFAWGTAGYIRKDGTPAVAAVRWPYESDKKPEVAQISITDPAFRDVVQLAAEDCSSAIGLKPDGSLVLWNNETDTPPLSLNTLYREGTVQALLLTDMGSVYTTDRQVLDVIGTNQEVIACDSMTVAVYGSVPAYQMWGDGTLKPLKAKENGNALERVEPFGTSAELQFTTHKTNLNRIPR